MLFRKPTASFCAATGHNTHHGCEVLPPGVLCSYQTFLAIIRPSTEFQFSNLVKFRNNFYLRVHINFYTLWFVRPPLTSNVLENCATFTRKYKYVGQEGGIKALTYLQCTCSDG